MSKIKIYDIAGKDFVIIPHAHGDYIKVSELVKYINVDIAEIDKSSSDLYDHEAIAFGSGQKAALEKIKKELEGR